MRPLIVISCFLTASFVASERSNEAIDSNFLESVLDVEECDRQMKTIQENLLILMQFADAGIRFPKGVLTGSTVDFGNYHQCLGIEHYVDGMDIQGKHCSINVPLNQDILLPGFEYIQDPSRADILNSIYLDKEKINNFEEFSLRRAQLSAMSGDFLPLEEYNNRNIAANPLLSIELTLGVCVPKPCTTEQAITSLLFNITEFGFDYTDNFCRLRGDKPWTAAEFTAMIIFSIIGSITLLSTCYDLMHRFVLKSDLKTVNAVYQSFSVYTNSQRLVTFSTGPGTIQCIDGIRTMATVWVVLGHSFTSEPHIANFRDFVTWLFSAESLWITGANITVDTFFTLGGILLVYTSAKKMTGTKLLKNLHWFYLGRIVRITPLLAATILFEASFLNHLSDGPSWDAVAVRTNACRSNWWHTLLHIQNLMNLVEYRHTCAQHAWYLAIDMQLYIVSPLIIYWVYTGKRNAWIALTSALVAILSASTIFNFIKNLPAGVLTQTVIDYQEYMSLYYCNILTRASPFFVGLILGYILHCYRDTKVNMPWVIAAILWILSIGTVSGIFYFKYAMTQAGWDNQFMDNFMNSFMRPAWACVISWMIFACAHGYGGPINWFLSLDMWRLPARLSYGIYLFHYPLMYAINGSAITPIYFTPGLFMFKFLSYLVLAVVVSYVMTVIVDLPITALYRQLTIKVQQNHSRHVENEHKAKGDDADNNAHLNEAQITDHTTDGTHERNSSTVTEKEKH